MSKEFENKILDEIRKLTQIITIIGETLLDTKIRKQKINELTIGTENNQVKSVVPKAKTPQNTPKMTL